MMNPHLILFLTYMRALIYSAPLICFVHLIYSVQLIYATPLIYAAPPVYSTHTCIDLKAPPDLSTSLNKLLANEFKRHPTHKLVKVKEKCVSHLRVEVIQIAQKTYLTGRINAAVPHREEVRANQYAKAVESLLIILLHNDPVRLRGPKKYSWLRQSIRSLKNGSTLFGLQVFQLGVLLDEELQSLWGITGQVQRELEAWSIGAQISYARLGLSDADLLLDAHLNQTLNFHINVSWYLSELAIHSGYFRFLFGIESQSFSEPLISSLSNTPSDSTSARPTLDEFSISGVHAGVCIGAEFFRASNIRFDLFIQAGVPAFKSKPRFESSVDQWLPSLRIGVGALFN